MAPVVLGTELNGYTIYEVKMKGGVYDNPEFMTFIPGSESKIRGDDGKDYWTFDARFAKNTIGTSFVTGAITKNVYSQMFERLYATRIFSLTLHEKYDTKWGKYDDNNTKQKDEKSWWEYLGNEYKKSQLKF